MFRSSRDIDTPSQREGTTVGDFDGPKAKMRRAITAFVGSTQGQEPIESPVTPLPQSTHAPENP